MQYESNTFIRVKGHVRQAKTPKAYRFGPKTIEALEFLLSNIDKSETAIVQDCILEAAARLRAKLAKERKDHIDAE